MVWSGEAGTFKFGGAKMFQEFYGIYPRKVGKLDAEKAWRQMIAKGYEPLEIIAGAKKFAAFMAREAKDQQYIPYPASWLRAGRWMDGEIQETIKPAPLFRPARSVEEVRSYYATQGYPSAALKMTLERAKSLEDLPAFAKLIPVGWNVTQMKVAK